MLSIYRRHREKCPHAEDRVSRKCRCGIWLTGTLFGNPLRKSAKTRNWEAAEKIKRNLERGEEQKQQPKSITIQAALDAFIRDCETRSLNASTLSKYQRLRITFVDWSGTQNLVQVADTTTEHLRYFRASWRLSPRTATKQLERLRAFFRFCVENDWITKNPAKAIKAPQVKTNPRIPFTDEEVQKIISKAKDDRELAFILTLRHTGLRIGDASLLAVSQLSENRVYLYTTKAGTPVSVVIPPNLVSLLKSLPPNGGYFFVRRNSVDMQTCARLWRNRFKRICKELKIAPAHPHRMRHYLASDLLTKGASVEDVAIILGNSPAIVQKHYAHLSQARINRTDAILEKTWAPALKVVPKSG
jgi:integrase/recombinase XerD